MTVPDIRVVSIRVARVTFVTQGGDTMAACHADGPLRPKRAASVCGRPQMPRVACAYVTQKQPVFAIMHRHARWPIVCEMPLEIPLTPTNQR